MTKLYYIILLIVCVIGCADYGDEDEGDEVRGVFPSSPVVETESQQPVQNIPVVLPPPVEEPVVEPVVAPDPELDEEEEQEPEDNTAPSLIRSTIAHGDVGVDPGIQRFVFTFNEEIDRADVRLWNNTRKMDMEWTQLIDGNRIILLKLPGEGHTMHWGELYTIRMRWRDAAFNWEPKGWGVDRVITFVTEIKE